MAFILNNDEPVREEYILNNSNKYCDDKREIANQAKNEPYWDIYWNRPRPKSDISSIMNSF